MRRGLSLDSLRMRDRFGLNEEIIFRPFDRNLLSDVLLDFLQAHDVLFIGQG